VDQFRNFIRQMPEDGCLVFCAADAALTLLVEDSKTSVLKIPYSTPAYDIDRGICYVTHGGLKYGLLIFGRHNMQNLEGARLICEQLGISDTQFFNAIVHFKGAGKRLQLVGQKGKTAVVLLMSSGNFGGINIKEMAEQILSLPPL
jgi:UDP-N-acetylmuramate: L-alanyl-gamma-D-glutamyl-meso-diaminopimelate ligase